MEFPYSGWVNHYDRGVVSVEVLGFDWYQQTNLDENYPVREKVYYRFPDGLISDCDTSEVFTSYESALEAAIAEKTTWRDRYLKDAAKAEADIDRYRKKLKL